MKTMLNTFRMKSIIIILILLSCALTSHSQQESFDIATYTVPRGWTKMDSKNDVAGYVITNNQKGTYCQLAIYKSMATMGNVQLDFATEWQDLIVKPYQVNIKPEDGPAASDDGWDVKTGVAPFDFNGGKSIAMLVTMSGYATRMSIVILTNTQEYEGDVTKFIESVELKKPAVNAQPSKKIGDNIPGNDGKPTLVGSWGKSSSVHTTYGDPVAAGNAGYGKQQYTFNQDGTYSFVANTFRSSYDKILLIREHGTYLVNGNALTIVPQQSVIESWSKKSGTDKFDKLISTEKRALEKVTYQYTMHYFSGITEWNLVLQAGGKVTERDGPFGNNTSFNNAWYFRPVSATNTAIDLPPSEAVQKKNPNQTKSPSSAGSFQFSVSNFDDGWTSAVHDDWVMVSKGETSVHLHYATNRIDVSSADYATIGQNAWNTLISPRYRSMENYFQFRGSLDSERPYFISADLVDNVSGRQSYIVLFKRGTSGWIEVISQDKSSFVRMFNIDINTVDYYVDSKIWEPLQKMAGYNKFAVGASDLDGKWTNNFSGMTQYVNVYTGADAGMSSHSSTELFAFSGNTYTWDLKSASGMVGNLKFQGTKSSGTFSMPSNWQVKFSDIEGKPRSYNAYFSAVKGARILWLEDSSYTNGYTGYGKSG
jgi:hypothetical protein